LAASAPWLLNPAAFYRFASGTVRNINTSNNGIKSLKFHTGLIGARISASRSILLWEQKNHRPAPSASHQPYPDQISPPPPPS
jgi:hypothetical protein